MTMTDYYNCEEVNGRHLVAFQKPEPIENLHYYDFDLKKWRPVKPIDRLPYGLCSYYFTDDTFSKDRCVVTSEDSYRLSIEPHLIEDKYLLEEKEWRDKIVEKGAEFEYSHNDGRISRAKVAWTKADIIPGVLLCGPRKNPNIGGYGYVFKESRKLNRSGTHFEPITEEELEKEQLEKEEAARRKKEEDNIVKYWKDRLPYLIVKGYTDTVKVYDTRPMWDTFKKYPKCVDIEDEGLSAYQNCLIAIYREAKDYDACFIDDEAKVKDGAARFAGYDVFFDLHVHNATYARMRCGDSDPDGTHHREFTMEKIGDAFTFPEITYDNPLFRATLGSTFIIFTDGDKMTYKGGIISGAPRMVYHGLENSWTINVLQDRMLFNGHLWTPSISFKLEDIIEGEKPKDEKPKGRWSISWSGSQV